MIRRFFLSVCRVAVWSMMCLMSIAFAQPLEGMPSGVYEGGIESGGQMLPATTVFDADQRRGRYVMLEAHQTVEGQLSSCDYQANTRELMCIWHDVYGAGRVVFVFSESGQVFGGIWYASKRLTLPAGSWHGQRAQ